jgi:hypothetical protein
VHSSVQKGPSDTFPGAKKARRRPLGCSESTFLSASGIFS